MKKSKKMLIPILAITVVVSAVIVAIFCLNNSDNNSNIKLTIDQKDFDTIKSKTSLSGTIETPDTIKEIIYEGYAETDNGNVGWTGSAYVNGNEWNIENVYLKSGNNKIVVTANTDKGSLSKSINIYYDIGKPYDLDEENISYDSTENFNYVNNIVLVFFHGDVKEERINEIIKECNGKIAGRVDYFYQVEVKQSSYDELQKICDEFCEYDEVLNACIDSVGTYDVSAFPIDPWSTDEDDYDGIWDESNPIGNNWGFEAVGAVSAWKYAERFSHINIGVVDDGFDLEHEDLQGKFQPSTEWMESITDSTSHGTGVAGIIGATWDNRKGGAGLLRDVNIVYTDMHVNEQSELAESRMLSSLIYSVSEGAKVINYSQSCSHGQEDTNNLFKMTNGDFSTINASEIWKNDQAERTSSLMCYLLEEGFDFIVVQGAGNGVKKETSPDVWENFAIDATNGGFWSSITDNNVFASSEKIKQDILNRIIIVGAAKRNDDGNYQQCVYSNGGNRVDICAPGDKIFTTDSNSKYTNKFSGTSAATPFVTGICGMVWSVNPNFTGAEVKEIVCNYTSITVHDNPDGKHPINDTYKMVNAKLAVEEAIRRTDIGYGTVTAFVKEKDTDKPLNNITVTVDVNGAKRTIITDETGKLELTLPTGTYTLTITSDNFATRTVKTVIKKDGETVLLDIVYLTSKSYLMGTVVDKETKKPVENASVLLRSTDKAGVIYGEYTCSTDKDGKFEINVPVGTYTYLINKMNMTKELYEDATGTVTVSNVDGNILATVYITPKGQNESDSNKSDKTSTTKYKVGDVITFGSYPQSKVTDRNLISALNSQTLNWKSYGYYSGNGEYGSMVKSDYMKYAEVTYKGNKYRAVTFSKYRPTDVQESQERDWSCQYENGYHKNTIYWFKYEPLKWRILDPNNGLVMCESIIDSQPFTDTIYYKENPSDYCLSLYNDSNCKYYANNYETSSIRKWLNNDFYKVAFSDNEKNQIKSTIVSNNCSDTDYKEFSSKSTSDKIFLLSYNEVLNSNYGFSSKGADLSRVAWGTDYAKCQGLYVPSDVNFYGDDCGKSYWRLRTAGGIFSNNALGVELKGYVGGAFYGREWPAEDTSIGIRPAMRIKIS